MAGRRRDSKHRVLRRGESIRADGKYQFKYHVNGTPHFVYSWRLEPTDKLPTGKKPCLSLRELEKQIGYDLDSLSDPTGKNMAVEELVERYLSTKTGVKPNTLANYKFVKNLMKKEPFNWEEDFPGQNFGCKAVLDQTSAGRQKVQHDQDGSGCAAFRFSDGGG